MSVRLARVASVLVAATALLWSASGQPVAAPDEPVRFSLDTEKDDALDELARAQKNPDATRSGGLPNGMVNSMVTGSVGWLVAMVAMVN